MDNPKPNVIKGLAGPYTCPACSSDHFRTIKLGDTFQTCQCKLCESYWINFFTGKLSERKVVELESQVTISRSLALLNYDEPKEESH